MLAQTQRIKIPRKEIVLPSDCCLTPKMILKLDTLNHNGRLEWTLTEEQISFIKAHYNYSISPYLFKIKTRKFVKSKNAPTIIKKLTKGAYSGKKFIIIPLKKQDIEVLENFEISYRPFKYAITSTSSVIVD